MWCYCCGGCYGHYCLNHMENYENETHLLQYMFSKHILIQKLPLNCVEFFSDYERIVCKVFVSQTVIRTIENNTQEKSHSQF